MAQKKMQIRIPKWGRYQSRLKGRTRHRQWVAINRDILHDPDFFNLTIEQRYLWICLLCHAAAVGVEYECCGSDVGVMFDLCPSDARVLFKLRRSADFQPLADQGFIEIRAHTGQDRTEQDRTLDSARASAPAKAEQPERKTVQKAPRKPERRATQFPADFCLTARHSRWAEEKGLGHLNLDAEWEQFRDYHTARGSRFKDWDAALRTWLRNAEKFQRAGRNRPSNYEENVDRLRSWAERKTVGQA